MNLAFENIKMMGEKQHNTHTHTHTHTLAFVWLFLFLFLFFFECLRATELSNMFKNMLHSKRQPILIDITNTLMILLIIKFYLSECLSFFIIPVLWVSLKGVFCCCCVYLFVCLPFNNSNTFWDLCLFKEAFTLFNYSLMVSKLYPSTLKIKHQTNSTTSEAKEESYKI